MVLLKLRISSSHSHSFRACQFVFEKSQTNGLTFETPAFSKRMPDDTTENKWPRSSSASRSHQQKSHTSQSCLSLVLTFHLFDCKTFQVYENPELQLFHGHCGNKLIFTSLINLGSEFRSSTSFPLSQQLKVADMFDLPKQPAWTLEGGAAHAGRDCPLSWRS